MDSMTLTVPAIDCEACARAIRTGLSRASGIHQVQVDTRRKAVSVAFDPEQVTEKEVRQRLEDIGFPPARQQRELPLIGLSPRQNEAAGGSRRQWYGLLIVGVVLLALAGYTGYVLYPRFGMAGVEGAALLLLASGAGVASFFSPCAFPLLVTLLARQTGAEAQRATGALPVQRGLVFAGALSIGAAAFLLLSGVAIALGGGALFGEVTFTSVAGRIIRSVVGALLVFLGLMQAGFLPNVFHEIEHVTRGWTRWQTRTRRRLGPAAGLGLFGFGYILAGFG